MDPYIDKDLLDRFFRNQCSEEEARRVVAWLNSTEDRELIAADIMKRHWEETANLDVADERKLDQLLFKIHNKINAADVVSKPAKEQYSSAKVVHLFNKRINAHYFKWAAVFIGSLLISTVGLLTFNPINDDTVHYATQYGEIEEITLPDGSSVVLNANSELSFTADWEDDSSIREVWLKGEAFFSVLKKPESKHPKFIVHANELNVEVLGTQFNVKNRRCNTSVVLNSGKVKLKETEKLNEVNMEPGELVEYSQKKNAFRKKVVNPELYSSWKDKKLIFDNTSIKKIAMIIEDNYGIKVQFTDESISDKRVSGSVPSENVEVLLDALSASFNIKIQKQDDLVKISKQPF